MSRKPTSRLRLEALEERTVPSITGSPVTVNTTPIKAGDAPSVITANATATNGLRVVVWMHNGGSTDWDIYGQMYNANGTKRGSEFKVTATALIEQEPVVGMDRSGNFVVAWIAIAANNNNNIQAARFSNTGQLLSKFGVATTSDQDLSPSIAVADDGTFLIAYTRRFGNNDNVRAGLYKADGTFQKTILVAETSVPEGHAGASVSNGSATTFSVACQVNGNIDLKRFTAVGALLNTISVAHTTAFEALPRSAMDNAGDNVVVWQSFSNHHWGTLARTVTKAGSVGTTVSLATGSFVPDTVNMEGGDDTEFVYPSVAMNRTNGDYVVAYTQQFQDGRGADVFNTTSIKVDELSFAGKFLFRGSAGTVGADGDQPFGPLEAGKPAVSIGATGDYTVTYCVVGDPQNEPSPRVVKVPGHLA